MPTSARRLGLPADAALQPWHYADPFFQEPPPPLDDPLQDAVAGVDVLDAARRLLRRARPTTSTRSSRAPTSTRGRARTSTRSASRSTAATTSACSATCVPTLRWLETLLHELGHAIYDAGIDRDAAVPAARARAHVHHRGRRDAARPAVARPRVARALRRHRRPTSPRHPATAPSRRRAPARVRAVGAGDGALRARALRRPRPGPRRALVGPGRALPAPAPPDGRRPQRLGGEDPPRVAPVYYHNYLLGEIMASQLNGWPASRAHRARPPLRRARASCCASGSCGPAPGSAGTRPCCRPPASRSPRATSCRR